MAGPICAAPHGWMDAVTNDEFMGSTKAAGGRALFVTWLCPNQGSSVVGTECATDALDPRLCFC